MGANDFPGGRFTWGTGGRRKLYESRKVTKTPDVLMPRWGAAEGKSASDHSGSIVFLKCVCICVKVYLNNNLLDFYAPDYF